MRFENTLCYHLIQKHYMDKKAKRSGIPYMNHIDEGLLILEHINATDVAKDAYCIHPILQSDESLRDNMHFVSEVDYETLIVTMEYRNVANRYLSNRRLENPADIYLGPMKDVHDMLVADKLQNYKDFVLYHRDSHARSAELELYFNNWFSRLKISEEMVQEYSQ